ncbi:multidrug effflux MFS transporter [Legionella anisa]|uniref:MFS transporter n=1 Tax=Legionella anisa TaxID=28082 RepID=A0AAX0WQ73_9GAMM|nr:multidrug effflux MFS transporter [Legionella anisa]KTC76372.1 multidrug resistance protein D [Legionella anisa]MBN5935985.1 multidrug effflux MFS transporter [Legionella anisa]PNL60507.1 MFS transporter [Legionella anisa]UAK80728.1 multidrug effflux MFS transporter [Legionella anisa]
MPQSRTSILLIGLLSAFSLLTFDLYQPSLPYITNFFGTTHSLSQLTLSIYLVVFGVTQLVWGPLIDHFGRRRLLPGSLVIAVLASIICALAPNIWVLILGRSLQGFALCCANLVAFSISRDFEDTVERAKVLSYVSMIVSISPILAPVLGSLIFTYCGWQANFMLMAVIGIVLLLQSRKGLFESPFWNQPKEPFIVKKVIKAYQELIPSPTLWSGSFIMMFSFAAVMLSVINSSYIIIDQFGFSPLVYGVIFIINGLNIIVGNYLGIWLRKYFSMAATIYLGSWFIIIGGFAMLLGAALYEFNLYTLSFALICNLGISLTAPATMSIMLADYKENTGLALAIIHTVRMFGSSVLTILSAYLLMQTLNALPLGLIACGLGALYSSWHFNRLTTESDDDSEFDRAEAA